MLQNDKLKEEQEVLINHLLKQAKDTEKLFSGEEVKHKDDVIVSMHEKWSRQRAREKQIEGKLNLKCRRNKKNVQLNMLSTAKAIQMYLLSWYSI